MQKLPGCIFVFIGTLLIIPLLNPVWIFVIIIGAAFERTIALGIPEGFPGVTAGKNGTTILYGYAEHAGLTVVGDHQLIANCRGQQIRRCSTFPQCRFFSDHWITVILAIVNDPSLIHVKPVAGHYAIVCRVGTCEQRCMADGGLCIGMLKMGVCVMRSFLHKITKAALSQAIFVTHGKIATHLINGDLKNEFGFFTLLCLHTH